MKKFTLLTVLITYVLFMASAQDPVLQLSFDGNLDNSGTGVFTFDARLNDWTVVDATYDDVDFMEGTSSISLDATGFLYGEDPAPLKNLDAFTVSFWMKWDGTTGNHSIIEKNDKFRIILLDGGNIDFILATENNSWYSVALGQNISVPVDTWVHYALYYDGSKLGLNMNGGETIKETAEGSITGKVPDNTNPLYIGSGAGNFTGNLDDLRFYNVALSTAEITELYDSYNLQDTEDPVLQLSFDGNLDNSGTGVFTFDARLNDWTVVDATYDDVDFMEGTSSISLDATGFLYGEDPAPLKNLDAFTVSFWMKWDGTTGNHSIIEKNDKFRIILLDGGNIDFILATENNSWYSVALGQNISVPVDIWVHYALYYDGSKLGLNMNGGETIKETAEGSITGKVPDNTNPLYIGSGAGNFTGNLDDLRFYNVALSTAEITEIYNSYTLDKEAPTIPANLTSSNITETSVDLAWDPSTDNVGVVSYKVLQDKVSILTVTDGTTASITGLTPDTEYAFSVFATDLAGNKSDTCDEISVTTLTSADAEAPTAPGNLTGSNITLTSVELTWDASTDNVGVSSYDVLQDDVIVKNVTGTTTSVIISGLNFGTQYAFKVKANDIAGNTSDASNVVTITTLDPPAANLVAQWTFEGSLDNVVDETTEFDAVSVPADNDPDYNYVDKKEGVGSLSFDGTSFLNCGEPTAALQMESFSVALWIKWDEAPTSFYTILEEGSEYFLYAETRGTDSTVMNFAIATENVAWFSGSGSLLSDTTMLHSGEWHHITFIYSGAKTSIYVDGELSMENPKSITGKTAENANILAIGGLDQAGREYFKGLMDDIRFYTGVLPDDAVRALFSSYTGVFDVYNESNINLYPNPTNGMLNVDNLPDDSNIQIYTITGQIVYQSVSERDIVSLDISDFQNGVYFMEIENANKRYVKKFVVNK